MTRPAARRIGQAANGESMPFPVTCTAGVLEGDLVRLEPLGHRHAADLAAAAEEDRTSYRFTWVPTAAEVGNYIDAQLARAAQGTLLPYAQVARATGRAVGATAYWDPRLLPDRNVLYAVEVGFTWLAVSAQRTGLNTEAKFLLFANAFEAWNVARVDLKTDARNTVSRKAIERTGARFDGRPAGPHYRRGSGAENGRREHAHAHQAAGEQDQTGVPGARQRRRGDPVAYRATVRCVRSSGSGTRPGRVGVRGIRPMESIRR
jgi:N-acetyltransferase